MFFLNKSKFNKFSSRAYKRFLKRKKNFLKKIDSRIIMTLSAGLFLIMIASMVVFYLTSINTVRHYALADSATSTGNVFGWAWNENFGWVSFTSSNCDADGDGFSDGSVTGCPIAGTPIPKYGANISTTTVNTNYNLSGYAWSQNLGWIYFGPDSSDLGGGYGAIASSSAPGTPKIWAQYSSVTNKVTGWAKILSLGNDGWLKMSDDTVPAWNGQGVKIDSDGNFSGFAWNGDSTGTGGMGWLSFNCVDNNSCAANGGFDYAVTTTGLNNPPTVVDMVSPDWNNNEACGAGALNAKLKWRFLDTDLDSFSTAYQLIVRKTDGTLVLDTGKCRDFHNCASGNCTMDVNLCAINYSICYDTGCTYSLDNSHLSYDTSYNWWIQVWDNKNLGSGLKQYTFNSIADTDKNIDNDPNTFTTLKHEFPTASFTVDPANPNVDQTTTASSTSTASPGQSLSFAWTFANADPASASSPQTSFKFKSVGNNSIDLTVTDLDNYSCSTSTAINTKLKMPRWEEKKPQ